MTPVTATRPRLHGFDEVQDELADVVARPAPARPVPGASTSVPAAGTAKRAARFRRPTREALHRGALAAADVGSATLALAAILGLFGKDHRGIVALIVAPLVILLCKLAGLYDRNEQRLVSSTLDEAPLLLRLSGLFALGIAMLEPALMRESLSGGQMAALWGALFIAMTCGRMIARTLTRRMSAAERCLVIGDLQLAGRIRDRLDASGARAKVIAALPLASEDIAELADLSTATTIRDLVRELNAHRIIIAPTSADANDVASLIRIAKAVGVRVSLLPGIFDFVGSIVELDEVNGLMLIGVRRYGLSSTSRLLKRSFDLIFAVLLLLVAGPLIAVIGALIRLDSSGPVFFRQVRVGRDGKHFQIIKFRSMVVDAESRKDDLRDLSEAGAGLFKLSNDPRVTRVGRFLRRSSLDELPQLLNVLRGEMSLVGPRPLVVDEDATILGLDRSSRLYLMPGMTGPWQVLRTRAPRQEMIGMDYRYADNWSLWLDLKILLRTALHVARRGNV